MKEISTMSRARLLLFGLLLLAAGCGKKSETSSTPPPEDTPAEPARPETMRLRREGAPPTPLTADGLIRDGSLQGDSLFLEARTPVAPADNGPPAPRVAPGEDPFRRIPASIDNQSLRHDGIGLRAGETPPPPP
jgi:hypothetical protein